MIFGNDKVFYFFLLLIVAGFLFIRDSRVRRDFLARWKHLGNAERLTGPVTKPLIRKWLELLSFGLIICALAHPLSGIKNEGVKRKGVDIVIALDVSSSMLAEDYSPNRLQKAKQELKGLLDQIEGHRIGLLAFAGYAAVLCPITTDTSTLQTYLDVLDTQLFEHQGTALSDAIQKAIGMFDKRSPHGKALVLITDGENHDNDPLKSAREAHQAGIQIYCIGIGSSTGEPIPVINSSGEKTGHKTDARGEVVLTKLDQTTLSQIASLTGGQYYPATLNEVEIKNIFKEISRLEKGEFQAQNVFRYDDKYQIPLLWAFFLLLWAEAMGVRRGLIKSLISRGFKIFHSQPARAVFFLTILVTQYGFTKSNDIEKANKLYSESKYDEAAQKYSHFLASHPQNPEILFNLANTLYQKKAYTEAEKSYLKTQQSQKHFLTPQIKYSLGNIYFRKNQYEKALSYYKEAMELDSGDLDAKYNYEICLQKLESQKDNKTKDEDSQRQKQQKQLNPNDQKNKDQEHPKNQENKDDKQQEQKQKTETNKQNKTEEHPSQGQEIEKKKPNQEQKKKDRPEPQSQKEKSKQEEKKAASGKSKARSKHSSKKEPASSSTQEKDLNGKEKNQMTRNEALELLEAGHNDKKDLLYNLLRSQQQDAPKKGKDW